MRVLATGLWAFVWALAVAACGGGGGGGGSGAALSFAPASLTTNVVTGASATLTVRATAADPSIFKGLVYVYVVDSAQVLLPGVELTAVDASTVAATLHTSPALKPGRYRGDFQVQLCRDSGCASQFPGSPIPLPYDLNVTEAPLQAVASGLTAASVHRGGAIDTQVSVAVSGPSTSWKATTATSWLQVAGGSGTGAGSFTVAYVPQTMVEGLYAGSVDVASTDGQKFSVPFTLEVLPTQFALNSGVPSFTAVNGSPISAQALSFSLDNQMPAAWSATSSATWLLANPLSGTTPAEMVLQPDPTRGPLASGSYSAELTLSSPGFPNRTVTTQLTLTKATLSANSAVLTLGGSKGRDLTTPVSTQVSLNTGTNSWPFSLSGLPAWLANTTPAGAVSQAGITVSVVPKAASVTAGSTSATVSMTATVNGDSVVLPLTVNLNADQHRLLASEWGVAFASSPTGTTLNRTLTISDNFSGSLAWAATSDASWLSVTRSGGTTSAGNLALSADASTLPDATVSYANVIVSSATSGVEPAVIRVALWKSANGLPAVTKLPLSYYGSLITDAIRPYVYVSNGSTAIDVYNAYTTQKVGSIGGAGSALGQMSVSPDGAHLYALDTATRTMAVVDLATMAKTAAWPLDNAVDGSTTVLAIRTNGVEVVLVGDGTAYSGGRSLGRTSMGGPLAATPDGTNAYTLGGRYSVDQSAMSGGVLLVNLLNGLNSDSRGNARDVAVSKDGTRAYVASGGGVSGGYKCAIIDAVAGTYIGAIPGGDPYPNNVEVTADGRAICGIDNIYGPYDFWIHSPQGALIQGYKIGSLRDRQLAVTPDGFVVAAMLSGNPSTMALVPVGP